MNRATFVVIVGIAGSGLVATLAACSGPYAGKAEKLRKMPKSAEPEPPPVVAEEIKFAEEDVTNLKNLKTKDGKPVTIQIWPINPGAQAPSKATNVDEQTRLTAFLNQSLRAVGEEVAKQKIEAKTVVLLAYCCSAGQ